jgi:dihydropteroate synthase type 2
VAHARTLLADGADVLDVGAESTHPDSQPVTAAEEIARLQPVVGELVRSGASVSVDTCKPEVMRAMTALGVHWLNDVHGFREPGSLAAAAAAPRHVRFVVMFSRGTGARAESPQRDAAGLQDEMHAFFAERLTAFEAAGVARERLVIDPGMGFFLGATGAPSLSALKHLPELTRYGVPLLVSVSRKGFLGQITGRAVSERGPGTLAAELWAVRQGAAFVRTHDVRALRDALRTQQAIEAAP